MGHSDRTRGKSFTISITHKDNAKRREFAYVRSAYSCELTTFNFLQKMCTRVLWGFELFTIKKVDSSSLLLPSAEVTSVVRVLYCVDCS